MGGRLRFGRVLAAIGSGRAARRRRAAQRAVDPAVDPCSGRGEGPPSADTNGEATFWIFLREQADLSSRCSRMATADERGQFVFDRLNDVSAPEPGAGPFALLTRGGRLPAVLDRERDPRQSAGQATCSTRSPPVPRSRRSAPTASTRSRSRSRLAGSSPLDDRVGPERDPRAPGLVDLQRPRRGHRRRATSTPASASRTPRSSSSTAATRTAAPSTTTTTGATRSHICPTRRPCDNNGHGTHTMGTMVGDDGDPGQPDRRRPAREVDRRQGLRVEPATTRSLSLRAVDARAHRPERPEPAARPRPDIVNNSWGGGGGDPLYQRDVQAWVASGIFPAFSNGNAGPTCGTAGSPGDYPESYSVGAFAAERPIASFSSRGPSARSAGSSSRTSPRRASTSAPRRTAATRSYGLQRHVDGLAARRRHRRADLVGGARAAAATSRDAAIARPDRRRRRPTRPAAAPRRTTTSGARASSTPSPPSRRRRGATGTLTGTVTRADGGARRSAVPRSESPGPGNRGIATDLAGHVLDGPSDRDRTR